MTEAREGYRWLNRIVGRGEEAPDQLLANPANWRRHTQVQQQLAAGLIGEVGWLRDVIVNRRTGHVVDGHMRVEVALRDGQAAVPVTYIDVSVEEELLILGTFDPVAQLAIGSTETLRRVREGMSPDDAARELIAYTFKAAGTSDEPPVAGSADREIVLMVDADEVGRYRSLVARVRKGTRDGSDAQVLTALIERRAELARERRSGGGR